MATTQASAMRPPIVRSSKTIEAIAREGLIADLPPQQRTWFNADGLAGLAPGAVAAKPIVIPGDVAAKLMVGFVRFVADLPARASLKLVWERGDDELWVDAASIGLACGTGVLSVGLTVGCDEVAGPVRVAVPFAVGRQRAPRGLLMSSLSRIDAPAVIAEGWSDAIVAFCWESILELAQRVCAQAGRDAKGLGLIPGAIAAEEGRLIITPMARHRQADLVP